METILIVDHNPLAREVAGSCLREHGLTPLFAQNGREALQVVQKERPEAVLTELHMPEMDGLRLVEAMRRDYSSIPVVLMTAHGSEEIAVSALRAGALSYVPKKNLRTNLCDAMGVVMAAVTAKRHRVQARSLLVQCESRFVLGYEPYGVEALVSHLQSDLYQFDFCDETGLFQVSAALTEALQNALEHGNLQIDSAIRERSGAEYARLKEVRAASSPYRDRRVQVLERCLPTEATYVIRDEGRGFDVSRVPDPRDPQNLLKPSGRGLMLMRTFMDEVRFNPAGNEVTMIKRRNGLAESSKSR